MPIQRAPLIAYNPQTYYIESGTRGPQPVLPIHFKVKPRNATREKHKHMIHSKGREQPRDQRTPLLPRWNERTNLPGILHS